MKKLFNIMGISVIISSFLCLNTYANESANVELITEVENCEIGDLIEYDIVFSGNIPMSAIYLDISFSENFSIVEVESEKSIENSLSYNEVGKDFYILYEDANLQNPLDGNTTLCTLVLKAEEIGKNIQPFTANDVSASYVNEQYEVIDIDITISLVSTISVTESVNLEDSNSSISDTKDKPLSVIAGDVVEIDDIVEEISDTNQSDEISKKTETKQADEKLKETELKEVGDSNTETENKQTNIKNSDSENMNIENSTTKKTSPIIAIVILVIVLSISALVYFKNRKKS